MRSFICFLTVAIFLTGCSAGTFPSAEPSYSKTVPNADAIADVCSWTVSRAQTVSGAQTVLHSVAPISSTNAWAVGFAQSGSVPRAIIEHFNGASWSLATSPPLEDSRSPFRQGDLQPAMCGRLAYTTDQPLTEHWNGATWQVVPAPGVSGATETEFLSVSAVAVSDVWAAGYAQKGGRQLDVVEHWNGAHWTSECDAAAKCRREHDLRDCCEPRE